MVVNSNYYYFFCDGIYQKYVFARERCRGRVMHTEAKLPRAHAWVRHLLRVGYALYYSGYVIQILSFGSILSIATGNPAKFAIIYSVGNVLTLAAY